MTKYLAALAVMLIFVGVSLTVAFIEVGPPMILLGLLLAFLGRWTTRPSLGSAMLLGGVSGVIAWYLTMPLACIGPPDPGPRGSSILGSTPCTALFGWSSLPAPWAGLLGFGIAIAVFALAARQLKARVTGGGAPLDTGVRNG